jgi:hypothetical protein
MRLDRISPQADVATLRIESPLPSISVALELDDRPEATVTGDPVVSIGYPTGIEGILARAGMDVVQKISAGAQDVTQIISKVASQQLIRPTTTQGTSVMCSRTRLSTTPPLPPAVLVGRYLTETEK